MRHFMLSVVLILIKSSLLFADGLKVPDGFKIELFATNLPKVRQMAFNSDKSILYAGSFGGNIYAITELDKKEKKVHIIAKNLQMPVGATYKDGDLYVSSVGRILVLKDIDNRLSNPPTQTLLSDRYPSSTHHGWKFIKFSPNGELFVPVGAPCNICELDGVFGSITKLVDGEIEVVANGIRNSVGFDWHPLTKELWFSDNGRDYLGDDLPPEEINRLKKSGEHFGYPYMHGKETKDPEFFSKKPKELATTPPEVETPAHTAPLGIRFYTGDMFPPKYKNALFVAEHGSWNREKPQGYQVRVIYTKDGRATENEVFASGWLKSGDRVVGRPADVEIAKDGSLLVSDDFAGVIYRISFTGE